MAECVQGATDLADIYMEHQIPLEQFPLGKKELEVNTAYHNSILMNTPPMPSFNKSTSMLEIYLTPLDKIDNGLNVPKALRHLVNNKSNTFAPTLWVLVLTQCIGLHSSVEVMVLLHVVALFCFIFDTSHINT
ncbi:hypothetical protein DFH28DRAFT_1128311 [Melampsora americana]|nr:hypothetical protein DFH28DRAFT_1128311 [Melampsora americana]